MNEHSVEKSIPRKPFIGHSWVLASKNSALVTLCAIGVYITFTHMMDYAFDERLKEINDRDIGTFQALRQNLTTNRSDLFDSLLVSSDTNEPPSIEKAVSTLEEKWQWMSIVYGIDRLSIVNSKGDTFLSLGDLRNLINKNIITEVIQTGEPIDIVICEQSCRHLVVSPILINDGKIYSVISETSGFSLTEGFVHSRFRSGTLAELQNGTVIPEDSHRLTAAPQSFSKLAKVYNHRDNINENYVTVKIDKQHFLVSSFQIDNKGYYPDSALLWSSEITVLIKNINYLASLLAIMLAVVIIALFLTIAYTGISVTQRSTKISRILPMLTELKYDEARTAIKKNKSKRFYTDEIDLLSDSIWKLTNKLESMQISLNEKNKELTDLAFSDPLTKLPNRAAFYSTLERHLAKMKSTGNYLGLLFIDIDKFKSINDTFGHQVGDQVLVHLANESQRVLRSTDQIFRLAGDEFVVIVPDAPSQGSLEAIANKLLSTLNNEKSIRGQTIAVSISIGGVITKEGKTSEDQLLTKADEAMYQSKHSGRGCYTFFGEIT